MIYFLYGEDSFRSREKLHEILAEYKKRRGQSPDVAWFDGETDDARTLRDVGKSQSLFQEKKLLIIERVLLNWEPVEKVLKTELNAWGDDVNIVAIFWEEGSEKDVVKLAKLLKSKDVKAQEFPQMSPAEARGWLKRYVGAHNLKISGNDLEHLLSNFTNTWQLVHEAEKLSLGGESGEPLFLPEEKIFSFLDYFLIDERSALRALARLKESGLDGHYLFASLVGHLRTLLLLSDPAIEPKDLHPFVVKKGREKLRRVAIDEIQAMYERFFEADAKIKIGMNDPYSAITDSILFSC
ncbi:MAG: hypothetical protein HY220_01330 [Candidatus Sungbacteria bacterium]|uniref:DNA polymerase III subunit delta n=1 Tax=Candidatus Sungiibacteriota bacterium TaxID=2750080 RepID=A0A9D6LTF6_9BACT|nr:hypothetical protein [Candidatus Sungbacteria bacterium]